MSYSIIIAKDRMQILSIHIASIFTTIKLFIGFSIGIFIYFIALCIIISSFLNLNHRTACHVAQSECPIICNLVGATSRYI